MITEDLFPMGDDIGQPREMKVVPRTLQPQAREPLNRPNNNIPFLKQQDPKPGFLKSGGFLKQGKATSSGVHNKQATVSSTMQSNKAATSSGVSATSSGVSATSSVSNPRMFYGVSDSGVDIANHQLVVDTDSSSSKSRGYTSKVTNPINKPIDGAPTRRPKVPKETPAPKNDGVGSTPDNPMTLDSSEDEAMEGDDVHQWCISAAHIGSLTRLDVTILEINQEHFEFNVTSDVLLAEVKVCVPWGMIKKIETHFSPVLHALVIHVESQWAQELIGQLRNAVTRQIPLELDPQNAVPFKRVISLEFVKEPPPSHLNMMAYYLTRNHPHEDAGQQRVIAKDAEFIKTLLPPVGHTEQQMDTDVMEQDTRTLLVWPPAPAQASITLSYADLECLKPEEFLNDSIIDFYLLYIQHKLLADSPLRDKMHLFNSFFYKALTAPTKKGPRKDPTAKKLTNIEKMHQQVKGWSRSIDLFSKDFIIVPINEHQHWYLAIICFPWLEKPIYNTVGWAGASRRSERMDTDDTADEKDIDGVLTRHAEHQTVAPIPQRPCILMFDSLVANGRNRVVQNIRNYLAVEWKTKGDRGPRSFTKNNFPGIFVDSPIQDNFCDCGVFLLHFVEKFFLTPINDYRFPVVRRDWFTQSDITKKRDMLRKLIVKLGTADKNK